jgi:CRISPR/Cas system-associated exonuclease Cas4 (RecB family)
MPEKARGSLARRDEPMGHLPVFQEGALYTSVSQLKTWLLCPRRFEFRYVRGVKPEFIPVALVFGTAIHAALARFYGGIKDTGVAPALAVLEQTFRDSWRQQIEGAVPIQSEDEEDLEHKVDLGIRMLRVFYSSAAGKKVQVEAIESPFMVSLNDPDTGELLEEHLVGIFDLVLREGDKRVIVEHKTSAKKYSQDQLSNELQPSAYKHAANELGWENAVVRYSVLTKTKAPALQEEEVVRGPLAEDDLLRTVVGVLRAIDAGVSYPVRGWQCRSCSYQVPCQTLGERK